MNAERAAFTVENLWLNLNILLLVHTPRLHGEVANTYRSFQSLDHSQYSVHLAFGKGNDVVEKKVVSAHFYASVCHLPDYLSLYIMYLCTHVYRLCTWPVLRYFYACLRVKTYIQAVFTR